MTLDARSAAISHVRLLAGHGKAGPVFEVLPARPRDTGLVELLGSPGLVLGCAAGDILRVDADGEFEVVEQGENLCVQAACPGAQVTSESFAALRSAVEGLDGVAEAPQDLRFIVVTVPRSVGLSAIARVMNAWSAGVEGSQWWVGNSDEAG